MEKHVTSLELSKKLKELGFPQESLFEYRLFDIGGEMVWSKPVLTGSVPKQMGVAEVGFGEASAYLASELGEWMHGYIGDGFNNWGSLNDHKRFWTIEEVESDTQFRGYTMPDCFAKMLIWLAENNYLNPKSL